MASDLCLDPPSNSQRSAGFCGKMPRTGTLQKRLSLLRQSLKLSWRSFVLCRYRSGFQAFSWLLPASAGGRRRSLAARRCSCDTRSVCCRWRSFLLAPRISWLESGLRTYPFSLVGSLVVVILLASWWIYPRSPNFLSTCLRTSRADLFPLPVSEFDLNSM